MICYLSLILDDSGKRKLDLKGCSLEEMDRFTTQFENSEKIREIYKESIEKFLNGNQNYISQCSRKNRGRICLVVYNDHKNFTNTGQLIKTLPVFYKDDKRLIDSRKQKKIICDRLIADGKINHVFLDLMNKNTINKVNYGLHKSYTKTFQINKVRDGINDIDGLPEAYYIFRQLCYNVKKLEINENKTIKTEFKNDDNQKKEIKKRQEDSRRQNGSFYHDYNNNSPIIEIEGQIQFDNVLEKEKIKTR